MNWQLLWEKIQELAISFYNFAMTKGESNFMLVNKELLYGDNVSDEAAIFFLASFVIMALFAVFACDSVRFLHPIQEIKEWGGKISIIKVVIFSATVFSIHTFYKMLVALFGNLIHANASVLALDCLGSYINPLSLMIYAYTVSTMKFQKRYVQAAFLGWSIFLTPAVMSFYGFTYEHITIYAVGGVIGLVGGILYNRLSPYFTCFIMYVIYFIAKYFMIYYSDEVMLLSGKTMIEKIAQYLACIEFDILVALILLLVLFGYRAATTEGIKVVKELICPAILVIVFAVSIVSSNKVTVIAEEVTKSEEIFDLFEAVQDDIEQDGNEQEDDMQYDSEEEKIIFVITASNANIRSGPGTEYDVIDNAKAETVFYGTGNEIVNESGRVWYEIYLDEEHTKIGWASEKVIEKQQ